MLKQIIRLNICYSQVWSIQSKQHANVVFKSLSLKVNPIVKTIYLQSNKEKIYFNTY